ncbi:hypothetical protein K502DRAFT_324266 [Neoconidiobolus thromboides FSU 785]|nr:hypothetical protein K502DRAFT_324266 [Neoconidiobolus thromboides FSU 785]
MMNFNPDSQTQQTLDLLHQVLHHTVALEHLLRQPTPINYLLKERELETSQYKLSTLLSQYQFDTKEQHLLFKLSLIKQEIQLLCMQRLVVDKEDKQYEDINDKVMDLVHQAQTLTKKLIKFNLNRVYGKY